MVTSYKNVLARAHKKFQRGQHSEIYLLTLKEQDKTKMKLSLDMVSISASICRTLIILVKYSFYSRPRSCDSVCKGYFPFGRKCRGKVILDDVIYSANHGISFIRYLCHTYSKRAVLFIKTYEHQNKVVRRSWRC